MHTHGEVMRPLLRTAAFRSLLRNTGLDDRRLLAKGTAWRLHLTPKGKLFGFKHVVPIIPPPPSRRVAGLRTDLVSRRSAPTASHAPQDR
jgi:hypothetical protein